MSPAGPSAGGQHPPSYHLVSFEPAVLNGVAEYNEAWFCRVFTLALNHQVNVERGDTQCLARYYFVPQVHADLIHVFTTRWLGLTARNWALGLVCHMLGNAYSPRPYGIVAVHGRPLPSRYADEPAVTALSEALPDLRLPSSDTVRVFLDQAGRQGGGR